MASNGSLSSEALSRAQSLDANGAQLGVNGGDQQFSDGNSEHGLDRPAVSRDEDADLFGDDSDGEAHIKPGDRKLDDADLDSGDDEGRRDRIANTIEDDDDNEEVVEDQVIQIYPSDIGRMDEPEPGDGDLYVMNLPPFLGLKPENYDPQTYEIPTTYHGTNQPPTDKFSPFSVASTTAFWRHDPKDSSKLQSNTRVVRWSDGSLTFQIASQPRDHYRISTTGLREDYGNAKSKKFNEVHDYNPDKDSQHYLATPHAKAEVLRLIHPFSAAMKILPSGEQTDEAVLSLQKSLAAAEAMHDPFAAIRNLKEDPELAKKRAELAEKDKLRAERKREAQIERETGRKDKVLGRRGRGGVGLTVGGLEDEDGMPTAKARKPARRGGNRRGDIYSDDEDDGYPRGRTREDEYDQDDGFLAASDEEPEIFDDDDEEEEAGDDDPDVDDLEIEGKQPVVKTKSRNDRQETPKRSQEEIEEDAGAIGSPHARKKRRVIDDDDDE